MGFFSQVLKLCHRFQNGSLHRFWVVIMRLKLFGLFLWFFSLIFSFFAQIMFYRDNFSLSANVHIHRLNAIHQSSFAKHRTNSSFGPKRVWIVFRSGRLSNLFRQTMRLALHHFEFSLKMVNFMNTKTIFHCWESKMKISLARMGMKWSSMLEVRPFPDEAIGFERWMVS